MKRSRIFNLPQRRERGVSLVEIMVGVALGLIASLVITKVFSASEMFRRNVTGGGDALQAASLASIRMDLALQEAGGGFVRGRHLWGCRLQVTNGSTTVLPRTAADSAPFASIPNTLRMLAAGVIDGGANSDVLLAFAGDSGGSNRDVLFDPAAGALVGSVSMSIAPKDMFLIVPQELPGDPDDCQIVQAADLYAPGAAIADTSLGGGKKVQPPAPATISLNTATYGDIAGAIKAKVPSAFHLGAAPLFSAYALNDRGELVERDLLRRRGDQIFAENVFLMKARYGVDNGVGGTANDNVVDEWLAPSEAGWTIADLMDGKAATEQKIDQIKAIRIALVARSKRTGPTDTTVSSLTLFSDLPTARQYKRDLTSDEQTYQYQVLEWVVPLRNMKAVPKS